MLDIGWSELFVIGIVALIVVGPKDLPVMFRTLGRFTAKARSMGREFQRAMDKAADDTGLKGVAKDLKAVTSPSSLGIDALQNAASKFEKWDPLKPAATPKPAVANAPVPAPVVAEPVATPPAPAMGPETAALAAKRKEEQAALMKRFAKPEPKAEVAEVAAPARAPRKAKAAVAEPVAAAPKPRAPRAKAAVNGIAPAAIAEAKPKSSRAKKSDA